jgi:hypothetical protein
MQQAGFVLKAERQGGQQSAAGDAAETQTFMDATDLIRDGVL